MKIYMEFVNCFVLDVKNYIEFNYMLENYNKKNLSRNKL